MACIPDVCIYLVSTAYFMLTCFHPSTFARLQAPFTSSCLEVHEYNLRVKHSPDDRTHLTIHMLHELKACVAAGGHLMFQLGVL